MLHLEVVPAVIDKLRENPQLPDYNNNHDNTDNSLRFDRNQPMSPPTSTFNHVVFGIDEGRWLKSNTCVSSKCTNDLSSA